MEARGQKSAVLKKLKERKSEFEAVQREQFFKLKEQSESLETLQEANDKQADVIYQNSQQMAELETKIVELNTDNRSEANFTMFNSFLSFFVEKANQFLLKNGKPFIHYKFKAFKRNLLLILTVFA